jgi:hypothetical protein
MDKTSKNPWPILPFIWSGIGIAFAIYFNLHIG